MKKNLLMIGLSLMIGVVAIWIANTVYAASDQSANRYVDVSYGQRYMMHFDRQSNRHYVYESIYLHASSTQQKEFDQWFAYELMESQIETKSLEDAVVIIFHIKDSILTYMTEENNGYGYGMMGRSMMYAGSQTNASCGSDKDTNTYAWYYMHFFGDDKHKIDLKFAELLMEINYAALTQEEVVLAISDVKVVMIDFMLNSENFK